MADETALHRCVSQFMLDTCHHGTIGTYTDSELAALFSRTCAKAFSYKFYGDVEILKSGSTAEFYIKPILSCIGDTDMMLCFNGCIAIPAGHKPPTELAAYYQHTVTVYEIINSHQPGYVYLQPSYVLQKNDKGRYVAEKTTNTENAPGILLRSDNWIDVVYNTDRCVQHVLRNKHEHNMYSIIKPPHINWEAIHMHGPAISYTPNVQGTNHQGIPSNTDVVYCIRSLEWLPQAGDWPKRHRNFSWPDTATISQVVSNGCDVVHAVHPLCRQDEWMSMYQWRLSFSRAEVTLLNSWTPVQQIVYHMLRFVMKREVLSKAKDNERDLPTLSNYHIKTLMLWECEQKPQSWWSAESVLIKLCSLLLHKLSDWVAGKRCRHYFITNCNILDHFQDASLVVCGWLNNLGDESVLIKWFVENYIRKCAQCCSTKLSTLFEYLAVSDKLEMAIQAVVDWRLNTLPFELSIYHHNIEIGILHSVNTNGLDAQYTLTFTKELLNFDFRFRDYFIAAESLHIAYKIPTNHSLTRPDILEILWTLFDPCAVTVSESNVTPCESGVLLSVGRAIKLARLTTVRSNALAMLCNELAKAYLHHSFTYGQESTYCVVHVLLAALYYKSGHYQTTVDHCKRALNQCDGEQYGSGLCCIGAEHLPQIDDCTDAVFGLILLYQHVLGNALNLDEPLQSDIKLAFTTELLAYYLHSTCLSATNAQFNDVAMYRRRLCMTKLPLLSDILLFKAMKIQLNENKRTTVVGLSAGRPILDTANYCSSSMDTSLMVTLLELVALEKLITVRQMTVSEVHSEQFPVVNEFEALYAYKCGLFEQCLGICRSNVNMLLYANSSKKQLYAIAYSEMIYLLDGELASLCGIIRLLQSVMFLPLFKFPEYFSIYILTLLLYLMAECQKQLHSDALDATLRLIRFVHDEVFLADDIFDRLILKLTYRSLKMYIDDSICAD